MAEEEAKVELEREAIEEALSNLRIIQRALEGERERSDSIFIQPDDGSRSAVLKLREYFESALKEFPHPPRQSPPDSEMRTLAGMAETAAKRRKPLGRTGYKTQPFKCLEDYERCCYTYNNVLCRSLAVLCIARTLIPFLKI